MNLSPDVLALNPELAAVLDTPKAVTPRPALSAAEGKRRQPYPLPNRNHFTMSDVRENVTWLLCPEHGERARSAVTNWDAAKGRNYGRITFACGCEVRRRIKSR